MSYDTQRGYTSRVSRWGDRIKEIRNGKGLTQETLADLVVERGGAMDRYRLSKIETGENDNPELDTLRLIAEALDVDIGEIFILPRPELEAGHGEQPRQYFAVLENLVAELDAQVPAEDTWRGDVLKAIAALNRALRRGPDSGAVGDAPAATRR